MKIKYISPHVPQIQMYLLHGYILALSPRHTKLKLKKKLWRQRHQRKSLSAYFWYFHFSPCTDFLKAKQPIADELCQDFNISVGWKTIAETGAMNRRPCVYGPRYSSDYPTSVQTNFLSKAHVIIASCDSGRVHLCTTRQSTISYKDMLPCCFPTYKQILIVLNGDLVQGGGACK